MGQYQGIIWKARQKAAATDEPEAEPDRLLAAQREHLDVMAGLDAGGLQCGDGGQAGHDAGRAVEIAALNHAVEMRPDQHRRAFSPRRRPAQREVGPGVGADGKAEVSPGTGDQLMGGILALPIGHSGNARRIGAKAGKLVEKTLHQRRLRENWSS